MAVSVPSGTALDQCPVLYVVVFVRVYGSQCTQWNGTRPVSCALSASCLERPTGCACIFKGDLTVCLSVCVCVRDDDIKVK